ncbi:Ribosomal RNA adenine methylase transferase [Beggiatoa sp. PS]|nr:Ribosomal RNA adenine methylase transferase [Beggiatoa sp. PS]
MHFPRKRFGQHFLHDTGIIQRIITAIAPQKEQHLVEIGPGKGALTLPLLQQGFALDVIEFDRDLVEWLKQNTLSSQQLNILSADALKFDFKQLVTDKQPLRIFGNLPYNISTSLLFHLVHYNNHIQDMTFMLQKEVVDRMIATPSTKNYGRLSVMLQYYCQINKLFDVDPEAFRPPPKVNSTIVQLIPHVSPPVEVINDKQLSKMVALAFSQKRKTLRNTLKNVLDADAIQAAGIDPQARAETLTLAEFARLANSFVNVGSEWFSK